MMSNFFTRISSLWSFLGEAECQFCLLLLMARRGEPKTAREGRDERLELIGVDFHWLA
jgi:hypothetical protein